MNVYVDKPVRGRHWVQANPSNLKITKDATEMHEDDTRDK
jgi:hypothetical protein